MHHQMRAIGLRILLVILMPMDAAITGVVSRRMDMVHRETPAHQHFELLHQRRVRGQRSHFLIRDQMAVILGFAVRY